MCQYCMDMFLKLWSGIEYSISPVFRNQIFPSVHLCSFVSQQILPKWRLWKKPALVFGMGFCVNRICRQLINKNRDLMSFWFTGQDLPLSQMTILQGVSYWNVIIYAAKKDSQQTIFLLNMLLRIFKKILI